VNTIFSLKGREVPDRQSDSQLHKKVVLQGVSVRISFVEKVFLFFTASEDQLSFVCKM
jgi:cell division protein FtsL